MEIFFVVGYTLFFCGLISHMSLFKKSGVRLKYIYGIFIAKVILGLIYNYVHVYILNGSDAYSRFLDAKTILEALPSEPISVLKFIFLPEVFWESYELQPYLSKLSYPGADTPEFALIKVYAILEFFTGGYFSGVIPIMALLILIVNFKLIDLFGNSFPQIPKLLLIAFVCFFPSIAFFTEGFYKDGLIYIGICFLLYHTWKLLHSKSKIKHLFYIGIGICLLLFFRWIVFIIVIPVLITYIILHNHKEQVLIKYIAILGSFALLTFFGDWWIESINIFEIISNKKTATLQGFAGSSFESVDWRDSFISLLLFLPQALINGLFRPFIWDSQNAVQLLGGAESLVLIMILIACLIFKKKKLIFTPLMGLLLFTSLFRLTLEGLLVENAGTIIRHRTEVLTLFIIFLLAYFIDFNRMKRLLFKD